MPKIRSEVIGPALDSIISLLESMPVAVRSGKDSFTIHDLMIDPRTRGNHYHIRISMRFLEELGYIKLVGFRLSPRRHYCLSDGTRIDPGGGNLKVYKLIKGSFKDLKRRRDIGIKQFDKIFEVRNASS